MNQRGALRVALDSDYPLLQAAARQTLRYALERAPSINAAARMLKMHKTNLHALLRAHPDVRAFIPKRKTT